MVSYFKKILITAGIIWVISIVWVLLITLLTNTNIDDYITPNILLIWGGISLIFGIGFALIGMLVQKQEAIEDKQV